MTVKFYKSIPPYGFLNNFCISPMFVYDHWWTNVEAAYQAQKTTDLEEYKSILNSKTPKEARDLGQLVTLRPDWDSEKNKRNAQLRFRKVYSES